MSLPFSKVEATHIVGGELNYRSIGNNFYEIRLTVYRDCYNGIPPFDNPASLGIFDAFNNLVADIPLDFPGSDTIPPTINSPCFIPPTNICYERTTYIDTVRLDPSPGGYQLAYQRCCRNVTILNIITPDATGATYYAFIPSSTIYPINSNPVFTNWPPPFICVGIPFVFDHSATEADGDSIAYEICNPLTGADTINPVPQPPNAPPYSPVLYKNPYTVNDQLGTVPPMSIDPLTGLLTVTPQTIGQFVVGICAKEFRNGIYLSTTRRDFQLNVVPCPSYVVAAIQNPIINCQSADVTFQNFSYNAGTYLWDFGVTGSTTDTSTAFSPTFIYPDTGVYTITLIAYSAFNPACADSVTGTVTILPGYDVYYNYTRDTCTNTYNFTDSSNTISGVTATWFWDFGDGATSNVHNPFHTYTAYGNFMVTLITTSVRGCPDTVIQQIFVPQLLSISSATINDIRCKDECNGLITIQASAGNAPYRYQWNDPLSQTTSDADSLCAGTYTIQITDSLGCILSNTYNINEPPALNIQTVSTVAYCRGACIGTAQTLVQGGNGGYQYVWSDPAQQQTALAIQLCSGNYTVTVTDSKGCLITDTIQVIYSDSLPMIDATADTNQLYQGQSTTLHADPTINYVINWSPSTSLNSSSSTDPLSTPPQTTTYTLSIIDRNQCSNSDTVTIFVKDVLCTEPEIFIPNAFSPNGDQQNDKLYVRGNTIESMQLVIYDRWGEKVFESTQKNSGWDGTYKGKAVAPGVFAYYLEVICFDQNKFIKKGNITVIR